jgi:hypothetical protein
MNQTNQISYDVPFTSDSSLTAGLHVSAALGGGPPHAFIVDTGSVGILVPRQTLGPDYQDFDPSQDIKFQYVSSPNVFYWGQWVQVPVVLGEPAGWDGTGDYPVADVEVFAVDRVDVLDHPAHFDGGVFGIGFAIGGSADGGPARNPLLHLRYQGAHLGDGYIVGTQGLDVGLTSLNMEGFSFIALGLDACGDWMQPFGSIGLTGDFSADRFSVDLPILMDTGIDYMILWLSADNAPPNLPGQTRSPAALR